MSRLVGTPKQSMRVDAVRVKATKSFKMYLNGTEMIQFIKGQEHERSFLRSEVANHLEADGEAKALLIELTDETAETAEEKEARLEEAAEAKRLKKVEADRIKAEKATQKALKAQEAKKAKDAKALAAKKKKASDKASKAK